MGRGGVEKRRAAYVAMGSWGDVAIKKKVGGGPCQHNSYLLLHVPHTHTYTVVYTYPLKSFICSQSNICGIKKDLYLFFS